MEDYIMNKGTRTSSNARSYLIVCFRFLGDVLVTTPLALSIKTACPDAEIDYLVFEGTEKVLAKNPFIRDIITIPRGTSGAGTLLSLFKKYDIAIAAYPSDRSVVAAAIAGKRSIGLCNGFGNEWWKHIILDDYLVCNNQQHVVSNVLALAETAGMVPQPHMVMGFDANDVSFVRERLAGGPYVILHPYSRGAYKFWGAEKWGKLAGEIRSHLELRPIFTITPDHADREFLGRIAEASPAPIESFPEIFTLNQLAAAIKGSAAYIGIDTAATHIAAAVGAPTMALHGPTWTKYWAPWPNGCEVSSPFEANKGIQEYGNVTVVQKSWECVPCNDVTCRISSRDSMECLEELSVEEVFTALRKKLRKEQ
jgi:heptosyltransferase-3